MGTYTGTDIRDRARDILQDDGTRWLDPEVVRWIDDGQRDICIKKPSAFTKHNNFTLAASAKQGIAALTDGHAVLDVVCNLDASNAPTTGILPTNRTLLTAQDPSWFASKGTDIHHVMLDPSEPKVFYVYPALHKTGAARKVDLVYAAVPPEFVSLSQAIALDDIYANALGYYLLFRLYSKDADEATNAAAAQAYYTLFTQSLGG